jgi:hypothetical protein
MFRHSWSGRTPGAGRRRLGGVSWVLLVVGIVALIGAHGLMIQFALSHLVASAGALAVMLVFVLVIKHLGWLSPLLSRMRRRMAEKR